MSDENGKFLQPSLAWNVQRNSKRLYHFKNVRNRKSRLSEYSHPIPENDLLMFLDFLAREQIFFWCRFLRRQVALKLSSRTKARDN